LDFLFSKSVGFLESDKSISSENLSINPYAFDNDVLRYTVVLNQALPDDIKMVADETKKVGMFECYIVNMPDINSTQIYFEYKGNTYESRYTNRQELIEILENLKESD